MLEPDDLPYQCLVEAAGIEFRMPLDENGPLRTTVAGPIPPTIPRVR